jgi:hypothetical protein
VKNLESNAHADGSDDWIGEKSFVIRSFSRCVAVGIYTCSRSVVLVSSFPSITRPLSAVNDWHNLCEHALIAKYGLSATGYDIPAAKMRSKQ